ncbi:DUF3858 domain-containing protein [Pedobacter gandavensis]|uniref:DUF3857 domain-containing protein n=1 Tax=Pedobacter gandavensis TaxID=2679963 RepID=UPI002479040E|nr:DUF3857 domain-containing protein [Pedobacter gandavensis]WGQ09282.1 DUF3858 domain-containing protein [Pedobacter gandavensis]
MNKIKSILCSLLLMTSVYVFAQESGKEIKTPKFGKINPTEFDIKPTGVDSAAAGIAIFDIGRGWFEISPKTKDFVFVYERHCRYKVINKNAYDLADLEIQLYNSNGYESTLSSLEACTYNMENGKIVPYKLNSDGKFSEKQDKNYTLKKMTLPNVKEGSILEFKYKVTSDFIFTLKNWYFQKTIPVLYSSYKIKIPDFFTYKTTAGGFVFLNPKIVNSNESIHLPSSTENVNVNAVESTYIAENVPALKPEPFITTLTDYVSKVDFELSSIQYPGQMVKNYTNTWPKIVKMVKESQKFGGFTGKRSYQKTLVQQIIKEEKNTDSVVNLIFNYVKNNIKWNDKTDYYASESNPRSVIDKKTGNSADINLTLYALLNEAGIPASPVLLSSRSNGAHSGTPMLSQFDNVIVAVPAKGEGHIFLDAIDKNHVPGLIAFDNLNHEGLKVDLETEAGLWIPIEQPEVSRKQITYALVLGEDHKLTGKRYASLTNYEGLDFRNTYQKSINEAAYLKSFKSGKTGLAIKSYELLNVNKQNEDIVESMDIEIEDNVEEAGNLLYFMPLLYDRTTENPFKLEDRKFPIDFGHPTEEMYRINIEFPAGYQLEKLPKSEKINLGDNSATFTFLTASEGNKLQISSKISIKKSLYTPEEYKDIQDFFKNIVRKQAEQVVLKKI